MVDEIGQLLEPVLRFFPREESVLRKLLIYLSGHSGDDDLKAKSTMSALAIGVHVFGKPAHWEGDGSIVREAIRRLREVLDQYYRGTLEGRVSTRRLEIALHEQSYRLRAANNTPLTADERFWAPYTIRKTKRMIVYTQPLFFWDHITRCYIRYLDINHHNLDEVEIRKKILEQHPNGHAALSLQPRFHYQSIGETKMIDQIKHWFEKQRTPVDIVESSNGCSDDLINDHNVILLGNNRTNPYMERLQRKFEFKLEDKCISVALPKESAGEQGTYFDTEEYAFALMTRGPNLYGRRVATLLGSHNGTAAARMAAYLTSKIDLENLFNWMRLESEVLPDFFQVLFRIDVVADKADDIEPIAWRPHNVNKALKTAS